MQLVDSRRARKHFDQITARLGGDDQPIRRFGPLYWAPRRLSWLIGALFMIGSTCFAVGPLIAALELYNEGGVIFFAGSIFFTSAAWCQYLEAVNGGGEHGSGSIRLLALQPHRIEWWSTVVQFAGTLFFNVSTFAAMIASKAEVDANRVVWAPDVFGSICFLVASYLALIEVWRRWRPRTPNGLPWWITSANMAGSIAFGISAIASFVVPDTGELLNVAATNGFTFLGAVGFFTGAYMLWPEMVDAERETAGERSR